MTLVKSRNERNWVNISESYPRSFERKFKWPLEFELPARRRAHDILLAMVRILSLTGASGSVIKGSTRQRYHCVLKAHVADFVVRERLIYLMLHFVTAVFVARRAPISIGLFLQPSENVCDSIFLHFVYLSFRFGGLWVSESRARLNLALL